jgi:N-acyl-D-aspartate/D-glutamate deacylase
MPRIIDSHTHFDAQITWDPHVRPSPALGVTIAVARFSVASGQRSTDVSVGS